MCTVSQDKFALGLRLIEPYLLSFVVEAINSLFSLDTLQSYFGGNAACDDSLEWECWKTGYWVHGSLSKVSDSKGCYLATIITHWLC